MGIAFQTSLDYHVDIQNIGCEYLVVAAMVAHSTNIAVSTKLINSTWVQLVDEHLADNKLGLHSALSYYRAFDLLFDGVYRPDWSGDQVGQIVDGKIKYWGWVSKEHFNYVVRRMESRSGLKHSVLLDQNMVVIYDPFPEAYARTPIGLFLFHVADHPLHSVYSDKEIGR